MSRIEWTERTWNPTTGCDRVSPGCDHCYAQTMAARLKRMGQARYQRDGDPLTSGPGFGLTLHPDKLDEPLAWRKPGLVFVNSMSDLFHPEVPDGFLARVWDVMGQTAWRHTYQVLTKRPQRMRDWVSRWADTEPWGTPGLPPMPRGPEAVRATYSSGRARLFADMLDDMGPPPEGFAWPLFDWSEGQRWWPAALPNVWLGTSIESDRYAWRADHLRATSAAVRFVSAEPLLGPLPSLSLDGLDWVIIGGESGPGARPMQLDWAADLVERCQEADVAVFVKQLGVVAGGGGEHHDIDTFPPSLQIREWPKERP